MYSQGEAGSGPQSERSNGRRAVAFLMADNERCYVNRRSKRTGFGGF